MTTAPAPKDRIEAVCVFCASSPTVDRVFFDAATELGELIGESFSTMVFGGGMVGLMGSVAKGVHSRGGKVVGVIPDAMRRVDGRPYLDADELIVTKSMSERKEIMFDRSDAFITLAGGFGTLDELMEVITLRQVGVHAKPIVILNTDNFFDPLLQWIRDAAARSFVHASVTDLFYVANSPSECLAFLERPAANNHPAGFNWND